jgi:AmmeMemoRadiSam system protein B
MRLIGRDRAGGGPGRPDAPRHAANAGSFYPSDPMRLARDVDALYEAGRRLAAAAMRDAGPGRSGRLPFGAVVPHAGLMYSGAVAATGWASIGSDADTILIAGTNHYAAFDGVGVWPGGAWETPLGEVAVDGAWIDLLLGLGPPFLPSVEPHLAEHSIEVQLPLLRRILPNARIAPFAVSLGDGEACLEAGRRLGGSIRLAREAGERVVLVASSDLAHYPTDAVAREVDARVLGPILGLDAAGAFDREVAVRQERLPGVACGMCGVEPVVFTLAALREAGASRGRLFAHATSADVPGGDPGRVVGYAAVLFED